MLYELRGEHRAKSYLLNQLKECANSICLFKMLKTARTCKNNKMPARAKHLIATNKRRHVREMNARISL